jgi:hypothetical protein
MAGVVPALVASDLVAKPIGFHIILDEGKGLRVHVTRGLRPDWYSVNHRVGWVDRNPMQRIAEAVGKKAKGPPRYRAAVGSDDIRLLMVADRINNSGKMELAEHASLDVQGFQVVYFFPYPETVTAFDRPAGTT